MKKRILKGIEEGIKELLNFSKRMINTMLYLAVATVYLIDWILDSFYNFVAYFYKNINKRLQKALFYLFIGLAILGAYNQYQQPRTLELAFDKVQAKELVEVVKNENKEIIEVKEEPKEQVEVCYLHEVSCKIKERAKAIGIDWKLAVAIAEWESATYTSHIFKTKNNVAGLMKDGYPRTFETVDASIEYFINLLKYNYIDAGLDTIEKIQPVYCPIGAKNDPNNLNSNWVRGVTYLYNQL